MTYSRPLQAAAPLRVAVVHDWLYVLGGAEKVLSAILRCFPSADLFCLFDVLSPGDRAAAGLPQARTSFLQRMPGIRKRHRLYLPLMPLAIEQLDLTGYDLVISSSYAVAKGVITGPDQLHVAYVHSPMRYAWDLQHHYLRESGLERGPKGWLARLVLQRMRMWDTRTAAGVDGYLANSHFVARRIRKVYGRDATVIWPPVEVPPRLAAVPQPAAGGGEGGFFFAASRLVPYKNIGAIVEAFRLLPDIRLVVAGTGPELQRLKAIAGANVEFVGFVTDDRLRWLMRTARAFVFAAEEDFGIVPVEAQAEGTPVIALGRGGARETVAVSGPAPTGIFFERAEPPLIAAAIRSFCNRPEAFTRDACYRNARRFSTARFEAEFLDFIETELASFRRRLDAGLATAFEPQYEAHSDAVADLPAHAATRQPSYKSASEDVQREHRYSEPLQ